MKKVNVVFCSVGGKRTGGEVLLPPSGLTVEQILVNADCVPGGREYVVLLDGGGFLNAERRITDSAVIYVGESKTHISLSE